jgi:hypothetical protein
MVRFPVPVLVDVIEFTDRFPDASNVALAPGVPTDDADDAVTIAPGVRPLRLAPAGPISDWHVAGHDPAALGPYKQLVSVLR